MIFNLLSSPAPVLIPDSCTSPAESQGERRLIEIKVASAWGSFLPFFCRSFQNRSGSFEPLKLAIGAERFERIIHRKELALPYKKIQSNRIGLTPDILNKILIGLGDVRLEDLEEAAQRQGKLLSELTTEEIDRLYVSLVPFEALEQALLNSSEIRYHDMIATSGKGYKGLKERVWTILKLWKENAEEQKLDLAHHLKEGEILTSRLGDREPPVGTIIRLHNGYYAVDRVFTGGGAYVSALRELTGTQKPILLCRGTAVRLKASSGLLSGINDLQLELGMLGIQTIWQELAAYLKDSNIQQVDIFGKSLGGGHAQYLATLIMGLTQTEVHKLETHCSVGVPEKVHEAFQQAVREKGKARPVVRIVRNGGQDEADEIDYIPLVGGAHLHAGPSNTNVYYLLPASERPSARLAEANRCTLSFAQHSLIKRIFKLLISFPKAHTRQTTLKAYSYYESRELEAEVACGHQLEWLRKLVAHVLHKITIGQLNRRSFDVFYQAHQLNNE